jgi:hypothetical protein
MCTAKPQLFLYAAFSRACSFPIGATACHASKALLEKDEAFESVQSLGGSQGGPLEHLGAAPASCGVR